MQNQSSWGTAGAACARRVSELLPSSGSDLPLPCPSLAASKAAAGNDVPGAVLAGQLQLRCYYSDEQGKILFTLIVLKCIAKTSPQVHTFL